MRQLLATVVLLFGAMPIIGCAAASTARGHRVTCLSAADCLADGVAALLAGASADAESALQAACRLDLDEACLILGLWQVRQVDPARQRQGEHLLEQLAAAGELEAREVSAMRRATRSVADGEAARATWALLCESSPPLGCRAQALALVRGPPPDVRAGQLLLELACLSHDAEACVELGDLQDRHQADPPGSALPAWLAGCWAGAPAGCLRAGWALVSGIGVPPDRLHGFGLLVYGCREGNAASCAKAVTFAATTDQLDELPEELPTTISTACDQGEAAACAAGAELALFDPMTAPTLDEVLELGRRACDLGDGASCHRLGVLARAGLADLETTALLARACALDEARSCLDPTLVQPFASADQEDQPLVDVWRRLWRSVEPPAPWQAPSPSLSVWPRAFHREACALGCVSSCARESPQEARRVAERLCERGEVAACLAAAAAQPAANDLAAEDRPELPFWQRACAARHGPSCWRLAQVLFEAETADGRAAAIESAQRACSLDVDEACRELETLGHRP